MIQRNHRKSHRRFVVIINTITMLAMFSPTGYAFPKLLQRHSMFISSHLSVDFTRIHLVRPMSSHADIISVAKLTEKKASRRVSHSSVASNSAATGAFKTLLPDVFVGTTHYNRALRRLYSVTPDQTINNLRDRNRKFAAQSIDTLMKGLTVPLTEILYAYRITLSSLHPYEATVANLTVVSRFKKGQPRLTDILSDISQLRKKTSIVAKEFAKQAKTASSYALASELLLDGKERLRELYESSDDSKCLFEMCELQKALRKIPVIELSTPTVVLVGSPNVGKSSIVREVSSGTPEVNNYPFTTRGVTVGHIVNHQKDLRFQVMDTPGLLDRPEEERNEMERLTYASMAHLPTAVIFVIDPTGLAGEKSTFAAQLNIRQDLRRRFPQRPWLDVVSKGDIEIPENIAQQLPPNHLRISMMTKIGIDTLKARIEHMLTTEMDAVLNHNQEDNRGS